MNAVKVRDAFKIIRNAKDSQVVLNKLNMTVSSGSIYGLMGASGCGKTTLLSCILGMSELDRGYINVLGHKLNPKEVLKNGSRVGYMPQEMGLVDTLTIKETLYFFGRIHLVGNEKLRKQFKMLIELLDLPDVDRLVVNCSGGEKRRISFAVAMIHEPDLVILDEPTVGVDSILRAKIWSFMLDLTRTSKLAIIITTHYIEEARQADRCGLMRDGVLLAESSPANIIRCYGNESLETAFLKLCTRQRPSRADVGETSFDALEDNELDRIEDDKDELREPASDFKEEKRKAFQWIVIKALTIKYLLEIRKQKSYTFMILVFPLIVTIFFYSAIGGSPIGLRIGIVSGELSNYQDCFNQSLVTAIARDQSCELHKVSCRFLNELNDEVAVKVFFESFEEAYGEAKKGKIIGIVHFKANFTESLSKNLQDDSNKNQINIYLDETNLQLKLFIVQNILETFKNYTENLMKDCELPKKLKNIPVEFMQPIYGKLKPNFTQSMAPSMMVIIIYFLSTALSSACLINDRLEGFWNRTLLAGVTTSELMVSYFAVNSILLLMQIAVIFTTARIVFNAETRGSVFLIFIIVIMLGYSGMSFGLLLSSVCSTAMQTFVILIGMVQQMIYISGIFWPLEGMPTLLRYAAYMLPFTFPIFSVSDIMVKGTSYDTKSFLFGIGSSVVWILVCNVIALQFLKTKKYSRNT